MSDLDEIAALVHRESGIVVRDAQHDALSAALERSDPAGDRRDFIGRTAHPVDGPLYVSRLLDEVTVKETYFMREAEQLRRIPWHALLARAAKAGRARVRAWSAACATGEEVYSLALLACEELGGAEPPVTILGTDISPRALELAREGGYRQRSTRDLDPVLRQRYFQADGDALVVGPRLRSVVTFAQHNLIRDPAPPLGEGLFDVILCRNVLIYFDTETVGRVTTALEGALAPEGTLILGAVDTLCRSASRLRALAIDVEPAAAQTGPRLEARALRRPLGRLEGPSGTAPAIELADAHAHFLNGLAELEAGDPAAAIVALRRALYAEPRFGLAAFQLGRAHEALGDRVAATRSYAQALRLLGAETELHEEILAQVDLADVEAACEARLAVLRRRPS